MLAVMLRPVFITDDGMLRQNLTAVPRYSEYNCEASHLFPQSTVGRDVMRHRYNLLDTESPAATLPGKSEGTRVTVRASHTVRLLLLSRDRYRTQDHGGATGACCLQNT